MLLVTEEPNGNRSTGFVFFLLLCVFLLYRFSFIHFPLKKKTKTKTKELASKAEFGSPNHTILENQF